MSRLIRLSDQRTIVHRLLFVLAIMAFRETCLRAQQQRDLSVFEGRDVAAVNLVGRPTIDVGPYRELIEQQVGESFSGERIQRTIAALDATGYSAMSESMSRRRPPA
jgi:hypothetical protein